MIRTKLTKKKSRGKPGPKELYHESIIPQVFELARFGMTDKEIAEFYEVSISTMESWKRTQPEFAFALYDGRLLSSLKVVESLHKQACGYDYTETQNTYRYFKNKDTGEKEKTLTFSKKMEKHMSPNVTAAIYLLKVRHGDKWADVFRAEITNNIKVHKLDMADMTDEELRFMESIGMKQLTENAGTN